MLRMNPSIPPNTQGRVKLLHGANTDTLPVAGESAANLRNMLQDAFNIPPDALAFVNGRLVRPTYRVREHDCLEFVVRWGRKGADDAPAPVDGRLLTVKEAATELHCSLSFVYKLMQTGQLAFERRGRRKLPQAASVAAYRQQTTCPATVQPSSPSRSPRQPYQFQRLFRGKPSRRGK
jgi:excisionase family DNA binding protein